jgi:hypothetical protein
MNQPNTIEHEFLEMWDHKARFFANWLLMTPDWPCLEATLSLIIELRKRGYDRHFRPVTSHERLCLVRAKELSTDKPNMMFELQPDSGMIVSYTDGKKMEYQRFTQLGLQ